MCDTQSRLTGDSVVFRACLTPVTARTILPSNLHYHGIDYGHLAFHIYNDKGLNYNMPYFVQKSRYYPWKYHTLITKYRPKNVAIFCQHS